MDRSDPHTLRPALLERLQVGAVLVYGSVSAFLTALGHCLFPKEGRAAPRPLSTRLISAAVVALVGTVWYAGTRFLVFVAVGLIRDYYHRYDICRVRQPGTIENVLVEFAFSHPYAFAFGWFSLVAGLAFLAGYLRSRAAAAVMVLVIVTFYLGYAYFVFSCVGRFVASMVKIFVGF